MMDAQQKATKAVTREAVLSKLTEYLCEQMGLEPSEVVEDADLLDDLGLGLVEALDLEEFAEEEFGFKFTPADPETVTVGDLVDAIMRRTGG